ncbi:IS3 family transposase [Cytobacillus oceanisediminis]|nr:IS3 family transposase [Cytobacillus oceanisediminis]
MDNASVESFFSHLKTEKLYINKCKSEEELEQALENYLYHYKRRQKKLKIRAPIEYRHALTA